MKVSELIGRKRDGGEHSPDELQFLLKGYLAGDVHDYHMAAWLMAVYFKGLTEGEMSEWTRLMRYSGPNLPRSPEGAYRLDKHSTGGVGDKTSMILVPLLVCAARRLPEAANLAIPMISGRGLGHSGGTLDKMESVPGVSCGLGLDTAQALLDKNGYFIMGQTEELVPADRRIPRLRDVTATVESIGLIVSSILSKKLAETLDGLVLDVKVGAAAFMKTESDARKLSSALRSVAKDNGVDAVTVFTRMEEPLGYTIGHLLEMDECAAFLEGTSVEPGLSAVVMELATWMLHLASRRKVSPDLCREVLEETLASREPLKEYRSMLEAQGGNWDAFRAEAESNEEHVFEVKAPADGFLRGIHGYRAAVLVGSIGGGRARKEDDIDFRVGMRLLKKAGEPVTAGETVARIIHRGGGDEAAVAAAVNEIFVFGTDRKTVFDPGWVIGSEG